MKVIQTSVRDNTSDKHLNLSAGPAGPGCWAQNQWSKTQPSQLCAADPIISFSLLCDYHITLSHSKRKWLWPWLGLNFWFRNCNIGHQTLGWNYWMWVLHDSAGVINLCVLMYLQKGYNQSTTAHVIKLNKNRIYSSEVLLFHNENMPIWQWQRESHPYAAFFLKITLKHTGRNKHETQVSTCIIHKIHK